MSLSLSDLLSIVVTQADYAEATGISGARASQLAAVGVLPAGQTALQWLRSDQARLREIAAGRMSSEFGGLDLVQERAALARAQRERIELQNKLTRGEQAPIELLGDALAKSIEVMVSELDQIDGLIAQTAPDLPDATRIAVLNCIAAARNKIASRGSTLVVASLGLEDDIDADLGGGDE